MRRSLKYFGLLMGAACLFACSKMEDYTKEFTKNGEIVYTGRADSLKVYPGRNRIGLSWLLLSDPSIVQCKVFWNDGADSVTIPVKRTNNVDTIKVVLDKMSEKAYTFDIYTYDGQGHSSVKVDTIGMVYGDHYAGALFNRPLKAIAYSADTARLEWSGASAQCVKVDIRYTGVSGAQYKVAVWPLDKATKLPDFKKGLSFEYRTSYLPAKMAIDTFHTAYESKIVP